jgi:hypothetical protein
MEIHRPKPWHGFRELLKEIGTIVVGVLIALGGEQIVQSLDRHAEVDEARRVLRSEIAANAGQGRTSIEVQRCIVTGLDTFVAWANGGPHPPALDKPPPEIFRPHTSAWEVVKAGAAAHMPLEERLAYTRFYDSAHYLEGSTAIEIPLLLRLVGQNAKAALTPVDAKQILEDAAGVRIMEAVRAGNILGMVEAAKSMGVQPEPMAAQDRDFLAEFCPHGIAPLPPTSS